MAVNYNFLKSLKGTAIGTIVPWTGDLTAIPKGWVQCNGQLLQVTDYPYLYEVIGNKYGGVLNVEFRLPNVQGRAIVDYHTSHASSTGMSSDFSALVNDTNDVANQTNLSRNSNIDLFTYFNNNVNDMLGFIEEVELNDPIYFDGLSTAGRAMGDHHYPSHGHGGTFNVVSGPNQWAEACQNNGNANCALFCPDDCGSPQYNRMEANYPTDERQRIGVFDGSPESGSFISRSGNYGSAQGWASRRKPGQNQSTNYNYVDSGSMDVESSISSPWSFAGVDTQSPYANFVNSGQDNMDAHLHPAMFYELTKGSMNLPATLVVNDVGRGNVQPINSSNQDIGTIRVNTQTPQLSVLHIIRAY